MIVTRLILHRRHLQKVIGAPDSSVGLYTAIVAMIIESYALYAVVYLLYIVPWALSSWLMFPFSLSVKFKFVPSCISGTASCCRLTAVTLTGHRSVSDYSASCQPESIDQRHDYFPVREHRFDAFQQSKGIGGW